MSRARDISKLGNINVLPADDVSSEVGIATTVPRSTLDVRGEIKVGTAIQAGTAGVLTASSFSGGTSGNVTGAACTFTTGTFNGNVTIGGTLTYEDVTNIDSLGIVTARAGVNVSGGQLAVGVAYSVGAAGVATAAGFVGPLTGDVTGDLTGNPNLSNGSNDRIVTATGADALNAEEVTINNIPDEIYKRWVSDEKYLIKILPKEDLNNNISMRNFVYQLQDFNKDVIGSPIISIEAGNAVKSAFKFAFLCAFIAITILLMLLIKIKYDALIILISVLIGSIFTLGFMLFFNIPLNFANIIGLPLLLGIGVDSGIHITERFYEEKNTQTNIYITSSMKGVIISSLTTIFSIGNLAFSSHQGTASMGLLLSVGLISMMFATMIVLPSFLIWRDSSYK